MDSLLSNAQRLVRKADSLVKYGLYDEALIQLDKSIVFLKELKSVTSCYDSIQMLNVQIDSIDRKMRSIAITRSESIKKKNQIENIINNNKNKINNKQQQKQSTELNSNKSVLIETVNNINVENNASGNREQEKKIGFRQASKLNKDEKSIIEELATTNGEYKKVNEFLINEIEQLKRENDYLKVELLKLHMNDSLSDLSTASNDTAHNSSSISSSSSVITSSSNNSSNLSSNDTSNDYTKQKLIDFTGSVTMTSQQREKSHLSNSNLTTVINQSNRIDLSKYINNEDEDSDAEAEDFYFNNNNNINNNNQQSLNDSYTSANINLPPNEFTVD